MTPWAQVVDDFCPLSV